MVFLFPRSFSAVVPCPESRATEQLPPSRSSAHLPALPFASVSPAGQAAACTHLAGSRQARAPGAAPGAGRGGSGQAWRQAGDTQEQPGAAPGHAALPQE